MKQFFGVGIALLAAAMTGFPVTGQSQVEHQHAAHVHGEARGTMVLEGNRLELELFLPGFNMVGFEHAPRTREQQSALDRALAYFSDRSWLRPHAGSDCRIAQLYAETRGFRETPPAEGDQADHGHEHEHDHDHAEADSDFDGDFDSDSGHDHDHGLGSEHAEFHVLARLDCALPQRLDWVDLALFERFPGNEVLRLDVLTDQIATRVRLSRGNMRVNLRAEP